MTLSNMSVPPIETLAVPHSGSPARSPQSDSATLKASRDSTRHSAPHA